MKDRPVAYPVDMEQLVAVMTDVFSAGGTFRFFPTGGSMRPMLRERRDTVLLCSPTQRPPQKYDVVLYRRTNGQFVLHRIIGQKENGFLLCGDHQYVPESGIRAEQVVGVLIGFCRKGRETSVHSLGYRLYAAIWTWLRPARGFCHRVYQKGRRLLKRRR